MTVVMVCGGIGYGCNGSCVCCVPLTVAPMAMSMTVVIAGWIVVVVET